ncbi:MAG: alpha/beta hydrolase [Myxococcales bacterium]|nr:alpha/beta hydrolase [Myxococcales bacterium]
MPRLDLDDASLHYETAGERGPRVLMVQGVGAIGAGWRPQIDALARDHRLAWFDNRGIGRSSDDGRKLTIARLAADALALMDHLGWERAHLIGHSMGGMIVQEAARQAPHRARSVGLLSTSRRGRDVLLLSARALWLSMKMRFGAEERRWRAFADLGFPRPYIDSVGYAEVVAQLRASFCDDFVRMPPIVRRQIAALARHTGGDMAPLRALPALIITGSHDLSVPTRLSDDLRRHLPHARFKRFTDAGHAVPLQHVEPIDRLLREHFASAGG